MLKCQPPTICLQPFLFISYCLFCFFLSWCLSSHWCFLSVPPPFPLRTQQSFELWWQSRSQQTMKRSWGNEFGEHTRHPRTEQCRLLVCAHHFMCHTPGTNLSKPTCHWNSNSLKYEPNSVCFVVLFVANNFTAWNCSKIFFYFFTSHMLSKKVLIIKEKNTWGSTKHNWDEGAFRL